MRILYLIGNGFDLNVGLNTAYHDFLKYYLAQPLPSEIDEEGQRYIERLKNDIQNNIQLWSDLELQYGKHMSRVGGKGSAIHSLREELDIINDDLREKLSAYIAKEDKRSFFAEKDRKSFLDNVVNSHMHLRDFERMMINNNRISLWSGTDNTVDFITFNYTRTLEHLLGTSSITTDRFEIHEPVHVHGYHDQRMILGVNDASQIENDELRNLTYALNALIKANNNHSYGVTHTNNCESLIRSAQLICCYGLSFGQTDKMWWEKVCAELSRRRDLIIVLFAYEPDMPNYANSGHKLEDKMLQKRYEFLSKGILTDSQKQDLSQRVFVSFNNPIFNMQVDTSVLTE